MHSKKILKRCLRKCEYLGILTLFFCVLIQLLFWHLFEHLTGDFFHFWMNLIDETIRNRMKLTFNKLEHYKIHECTLGLVGGFLFLFIVLCQSHFFQARLFLIIHILLNFGYSYICKKPLPVDLILAFVGYLPHFLWSVRFNTSAILLNNHVHLDSHAPNII